MNILWEVWKVLIVRPLMFLGKWWLRMSSALEGMELPFIVLLVAGTILYILWTIMKWWLPITILGITCFVWLMIKSVKRVNRERDN